MTAFLAKMIYSNFGLGEGTQAGAANGLALVLLGLVIGVVGATILFVWLAARDRRERQDSHRKEVADVIEEVFGDETEGGEKAAAAARAKKRKRGKPGPTEPWERADDWWKKGK